MAIILQTMAKKIFIEPLQYLTQDVPGISHAELAEEACIRGIKWVQLRIKHKPIEYIREEALKTLAICRKYNALFIMNDHVELAKSIHADGVHLGKSDMNPIAARKILGDHFIIGGTANTFEDIQLLTDAGVNYIGLGPYRFTPTKENLSPILGLEGYKTILAKCKAAENNMPIIAIGGITVPDVLAIIEAGFYGIAVSSAINLAKNDNEKTYLINELINKTTLWNL